MDCILLLYLLWKSVLIVYVVVYWSLVAHFFEMTMYVVGEDAQSLSVAVRRRGYLDRQSSVNIVPKNGTGEISAQGMSLRMYHHFEMEDQHTL